MRKIYISAILVITVCIALSVIFFQKVKEGQVAYQKNILLSQAQRCGDNVERTLGKYESDLNRIIFNHNRNIYKIFDDPKTFNTLRMDLEGFYARYRDLVTNISIVDNNDRFLGIYINDNDDFVVDTFSRKSTNKLEEKVVTKRIKSGYASYFPYFFEGQVNGNIVVEINLDKYLLKAFELYKIPGLVYQWVLSPDGEILLSNFDLPFEVHQVAALIDSIRGEREGSLEHGLKLKGRNYKVISAFYPINLAQNKPGLVFSINSGHLLDIFEKKYTLITAIVLGLLISLIAWLIFQVYLFKRNQSSLNMRLTRLRLITEHFPLGLMVLNKKGEILMLNHTGQKMLFKEKNENIVGKNFNDQFLVTNQYILEEGGSGNYEKDHFIHYVREGNEIVIYRKDELKQILGEELTIVALMDVSPIEKSRRQESAANQAKSDFLARMSQEIRLPMNGIIDTSQELLSDSLSKTSKEKVKTIRESASLLVNMVNDFMDISRIEAGKMMLEEIPFNIESELNSVAEFYLPIAKEKDIEFSLTIDPSVPQRIIGDPFRLRQVVSSLVANALHTTLDGSVSVSLGVMDRYKNKFTLIFRIVDTGIGISKEKLDAIFKGYEYSETSSTGKQEGTGLGMVISKQLVEMMNGEIWVESPSSLNPKNTNFPGTNVAFTIDVFSNEKQVKNLDFSPIKRYNQVTALILSRKKEESDHIHHILDSFGINFIYKIYDDKDIPGILKEIENNRPLYQLIIIKDKPAYDGFAMALRLKESGLSSFFPVVLISSNDKKGNYRKCRSLDIDYYLIQPYDTHEVFQILRESFKNIEDSRGILDQVSKIKNNLKILVADDNLINQRMMQSLLRHLGQEADIAGNGEEAVTMNSGNQYDLVFMDLVMPVKDGLTAIRELRATGNKVQVVAMINPGETGNKDLAINLGVEDFLTRPINVEALKQLLINRFSEVIET